ncbi:MAG: thioredoxin reductase, partial [Solirubrobacteraceae bacterium]|nr:thioredoxin reductase [Solirubrobacteraceae bacterium]
MLVVGRRLEPADHRVRDFLTRGAQPHRWIETGSDEAVDLFARLGLQDPPLPVVVDGDRATVGATVEQLAELWGISGDPRLAHYDLAIVGAGPAGLAAAVYAASDGLSTVVFERDVPGGQASHTSKIENFFGFPGGIGGAELARLAGRQAEGFGAELVILRGVESSRVEDEGFGVTIAGGVDVTASTVLASPGMEWRRLEVDGVDELLGRGVYYGAGRSEATQCSDDDVVVIGAGNSAGQAVLNLANASARVTMVVRGDRLGKTMSAYLVDRIEQHPLVDIRFGAQVTELHPDDGHLAAATITVKDGTAERRDVR